ncbi:NifB/NifX family molybdenum-iron cluster-binding protein [Edwardsiella tarda]
MLTAIPMHGARIAGHLARAPQLAFFNANGEEVARYANPAASEQCSGKKQLLALLRQGQIRRLVVRNVGQHMAQRLLALGIEIRLAYGGEWQADYCQEECNLAQLTDASQARPPRKPHHAGHACGCGGSAKQVTTPTRLQPRPSGVPHIIRCRQG